MAQACDPLRKYYRVDVKFTAGGICPNTLRSHVEEIQVLPGISWNRTKKLINRVLMAEALDYAKLWSTFECEGESDIQIKWTKNPFESHKNYVTVSVNERKWMRLSLQTILIWSDLNLKF